MQDCMTRDSRRDGPTPRRDVRRRADLDLAETFDPHLTRSAAPYRLHRNRRQHCRGSRVDTVRYEAPRAAVEASSSSSTVNGEINDFARLAVASGWRRGPEARCYVRVNDLGALGFQDALPTADQVPRHAIAGSTNRAGAGPCPALPSGTTDASGGRRVHGGGAAARRAPETRPLFCPIWCSGPPVASPAKTPVRQKKKKKNRNAWRPWPFCPAPELAALL